ncbi:MAG: hypothetical protein AAFV53_22610 [Myxococcota bacterium]
MGLRTLIPPILLSLLTVGCGSDAQPKFRLVSIYDPSAVVGLDPEAEQTFLWRSARGMDQSCGPAKGADGIGLYDADLIASGMSPVLGVVLEHTQDIDDYLEQRKDTAFEEARAVDPAFNADKWEKDWNANEAKNRRRPAVTNADISLALGIEQGEFLLQPSAMPRNLAVRIDGDDTNIRYQQLVRTQMEVELCMEHKVGRGWMAAGGDQLRQALLLDRPEGTGPDRRFFGGQRDPVVPLIGPPDACLRVSDSLKDAAEVGGGKGDGSTDLVPSDVWGAALRDCESFEGKQQRVLQPSPVVPLTLTDNGDLQGRSRDRYWSDLVVEVGTGDRDEDIKVTVTYENRNLGEDWPNTLMEDEPLFSFQDKLDEDGRKKGGMTDLLSKIPHIYPTVGPRWDPDRYVVLYVPAWQVNEGLRRIFERTCEDVENRCVCTVTGRDGTFTCLNDYNEECELGEEALKTCQQERDLQNPMLSAGVGVRDGVSWVLENPELLFVQVDLLTGQKELEKNAFDLFAESMSGVWDNLRSSLPTFLVGDPPGDGDLKPNLAVVTQGGPLNMQNWGYTVGTKMGRSPVVLPLNEGASWSMGQEAQRARQHSFFLLSLGTVLGFLIIGIRRLPDLWTRTPEERAYYWPGRQSQKEQEEVDPEGVEAQAASNED